ncbi:MAG: YfhO family protein, partial [Anaerolineales bacterium]
PSLSPLSISISPLSLSPPFQRKWVWAVSVFLAVDLLVAGWGLNPGIDPGFYRGDAPTASRVREMLGEGRLFLPNQDEYDLTFERYFLFDTFEGDWETLRGSLLPNLNMLDGLPSANNFDPLLPERYVRWLDAVNRADPETQAKMLDLMGVRLIERVDPANPAGVRFDPAGGLPRFRWTPCARPANNADIVWDRLVGDPDGKFPGMVNLEGGQANAEWVCGDDRQMEATAQITKVSETPNQLRVRVQSDTSGWLIIADTWYPGWRAQVDGKPARVLPADFVFRAIPTPPGTHEIVLTYQPFSFYLGAAVSTVAWIGVAFTWVRGKRDE